MIIISMKEKIMKVTKPVAQTANKQSKIQNTSRCLLSFIFPKQIFMLIRNIIMHTNIMLLIVAKC